MQEQHKEAIQKNFTSLVEQTDLDLMVTVLYEKGVFSEAMIEPYRDINKDTRNRKRFLYREITRRGPDAFRHLVDALSENGYWNLVRELDPTSSLHPPSRPIPSHSGQGESKFLSLFDKRRTTGKEQNDPNSNREAPCSTPGKSPQEENITAARETNGNAEPPAQGPSPSGDSLDQSGIPQFNVIKSTKFFEDNGSDIKLYRTRGRQRGVLVLFSYIAFKHGIEEFRHGARVDIDNLRYLFTELGFKVLSYLNLSLKETKETLELLKKGMCGEGAETVFVVFSSHGYARAGTGDTDIRCSDGHLISYYEIIKYFNNENFPALKGVPKVFIFQTCRGSNKDHVRAPQHLPAPPARVARVARSGGTAGTAHDGHRYDSDDSDDAEPDDGDKTRDRMYSDILIAHSTVPGYTSNRDKENGSWYIQALCEIFAARAHDCHVEKLFTLVDMKLRQRFATQTSSVDRWGFNRRLYLHPGLYED